jgi:hypothetical protein
MRTLSIVRIVFFALLLAYALYAMPWSYIVLPKEGTSLALPLVISDVKALAMATWLGVAWIGIDAYLSFRLLRREKAKATRAPEAAR